MAMTKSDDLVVRRFEVEVGRGASLADVKRELAASDAKLHRPEINMTGPNLLEVRLEGSASTVSEAMTQLTAVNGVRVRHDRTRRPQKQEPDPGIPDLPPGVAVSTTVVVAVVDSGIMVNHPKFKGRLWSSTFEKEDYVHGARCIGNTRTADVTDQDGHGTRLAGTILSAAHGEPGIRLLTVKFFDPDNLPGPTNGAAAIEFAARARDEKDKTKKVDIINLSWDLGMGSPGLQKAITEACRDGALVVIAAGNSGTNNDDMPAIPAHYRELYPDRIITVMATDRYNEKATFSNYGVESVDLAAPGVEVDTTRASLTIAPVRNPKDDPFFRPYRFFRGTSASAALVSGMAALLKSRNPGLTADQLKVHLCAAAKRLPSLRSKCAEGKFLDPDEFARSLSPASPPGGGGPRSGYGPDLGAGSLR